MNSEHILFNNIIKFSMFNMSTTIGENIKYCMYKYNIAMSVIRIHYHILIRK